jgi:hypothetical protein
MKTQTNKTSFAIETGVPIPKVSPGRHCKYPWASMKVGDSIFVDTANVSTLVCAISYGKSHNMKFVSRVENKGRRIWRIE